MKLNSLLELEIWADSFHEGNWMCEELGKIFIGFTIEYIDGYIPRYTFKIDELNSFNCTVYGRYDNWEPLPNKVVRVKNYGKPDMILYDPIKDEVLLAIEETAAVPTGNQSLQRCERFYGSAIELVPFWYLIGEFGIHKDGNVRRDSIWPTILSLRLSNIFCTPSIVLHYSDKENPEDYSIGEGVNILFSTVADYIKLHLNLIPKDQLVLRLTKQYEHMFEFIKSQYSSIVSYLPSQELLNDLDLPRIIAKSAVYAEPPDERLKEFLVWPVVNELPKAIRDLIKPGGIINDDSFVNELELLVQSKKAYNIIIGSGSKPQKWKSIQNWIRIQKKDWQTSLLSKKKELNFDMCKFAKTENGNFHLTTAKNVFYLADESAEIELILKKLFNYKDNFSLPKIPAFIYIVNSLVKGRIFGDPFTGQLAAYSNIFCKNNLDEPTRLAVVYYPYQVHTQLFKKDNVFNANKGISILRQLVDYAIFHNGVIVNMKTGEVTC